MRHNVFHLLFLSWVFLISCTHELQTTQLRLLLQLRQHLEYPIQLTNWENYNADFCSLPSTLHVTIKCEDNSVTELKIMGDKLPRVSSLFHGFPIPNQTLSENFSIDSLVVTLARLTTLTVLSLVSLGIWGPLPDKIHRLHSLQVLDLSSNFIFGSVPNEISRLKKLHTLALDANFFNESIPDWFDSLSNLTILSLKNNRLKGHFPSSICKLTTLTDVVLSHNHLSGKLPDLSTLSSLHLLDLRENHLDSQLPLLPKGVTTVLLSNNSFSDNIPQDFQTLHRLHHLDLSCNSLVGTPPAALFTLPNITYLNLASNMLSGSLSNSIKCGNKLGFVDISSNRFTGRLPSCLDTISGNKRVVKFSGNCLSVGNGKHPESDCKQGSMRKKPSWGKALWVLIVVICAVICLVSFAIVFLIFRKRYHPRKTVMLQHTVPKVTGGSAPTKNSSEVTANARNVSEASELGTQVASSCRVFSMEDLVEATGNFDQSAFLGEGSIGKLYKGRLQNGGYVAIRSLSLFKRYSIRNLKVRLDLLSKLRHPHLVSFLGYCIHDGGVEDSTSSKIFLVYECISNGNFRAFLSADGPERVLKWSDRLGVLIGVAKAVHFLHTGVIPASSSNRLKTNNILLDDYRIAKLSDYGMSVITGELEQLEAKGDGAKSWHLKKLGDDVYDFGFILLEALVGPIVSGKGEAFLLNEMKSFGSEDGRQRIVDPVVLTTCCQESLSIVISITNKCISAEATKRPSFEDVLWNLQYAAQVQTTADVEQKAEGAS
ncbi:probable inactive leucine-rich repeat receptor-like protein kinase At3g03770 [Cynara cardunculus var. scolymus]|uniref:probable inactive leucine-rich repeat receptor-like protein kinase At3g03770 n=1 Tax=Cynara cardunculus var. scolymus TaxID=59895 RepID=UPI000D623102|nr:probable inactive leucine-rich repeat receptor-like protein kinase At3g03770 [Cynara cardunculus var. scolymus]